MDSLKKYAPYLGALVLIGGAVVYLNVDVRSSVKRSVEDYFNDAKQFKSPCEIAHTRYDKEGKPYSAWSFDECMYLVKGIPQSETGDCLKKEAKGGSWAYTCSMME